MVKAFHTQPTICSKPRLEQGMFGISGLYEDRKELVRNVSTDDYDYRRIPPNGLAEGVREIAACLQQTDHLTVTS